MEGYVGSQDSMISQSYQYRLIIGSRELVCLHVLMLLGHTDDYTTTVKMQETIAFNNFREGLVQRMPRYPKRSEFTSIKHYSSAVYKEKKFNALMLKRRCRHGYFHVVNNDYTHWEMYTIGGSANPTINSQGNRFLAPDDRSAKEVSVASSILFN